MKAANELPVKGGQRMWISSWAQCNAGVLQSARSEQKKENQRGDRTRKVWPTVAGARGSSGKECGRHLGAGKGQETPSPRGPPEGTQPCPQLDFSPGKPVWGY